MPVFSLQTIIGIHCTVVHANSVYFVDCNLAISDLLSRLNVLRFTKVNITIDLVSTVLLLIVYFVVGGYFQHFVLMYA